ncbi:MAG: ribonuclease P protein component [Oscillospiraceae bacterium]|nr:ribonuclease P protein component [Oscillospiraceae bacterium]
MSKVVTIKKNHEFRRLYAKGASAVSPYLVIYCRKNKLGVNRIGITVSTKLGCAVVRNRIRRRLREIYRLNAGKLASGYDIVIVARGRAVNAPYRELETAFFRLTAKLPLRAEEVRP